MVTSFSWAEQQGGVLDGGWFRFSSCGFPSRAGFVLLGCHDEQLHPWGTGYERPPDPQPYAQGDGQVTGVVVGLYGNGREAFLQGTAGLPRGPEPSSPALPTRPCSLPGSYWKADPRRCPVNPQVSNAAAPQTAIVVEAGSLKKLLKAMTYMPENACMGKGNEIPQFVPN